jgi:hypothetical protein
MRKGKPSTGRAVGRPSPRRDALATIDTMLDRLEGARVELDANPTDPRLVGRLLGMTEIAVERIRDAMIKL